MKELNKAFWNLRKEIDKLNKQKRRAILNWDLNLIEAIEGKIQESLFKSDAIIDKMKLIEI